MSDHKLTTRNTIWCIPLSYEIHMEEMYKRYSAPYVEVALKGLAPTPENSREVIFFGYAGGLGITGAYNPKPYTYVPHGYTYSDLIKTTPYGY